MSPLVLSTCPGCKNRLRIPAEWLDRSIRCKHCGLVLQARQASASPGNPATPPPTAREQVTPAPVAAAPAVPLAMPVSQPASGSPFANLHEEEDESPRARRRRPQRKSGNSWMGAALAVAGFIIAGFLVYLNWERLAALLPADDEPLAQNERNQGAVKEPPTNSQKPKLPSSGKAPKKNDLPRNGSDKKPPADSGRGNAPTPRPKPGSNLFPRRALIISIDDYLYANPLQNGMSGPQAANLNNLINNLNVGLHVPLTQVAHLSDDAGPKWGARAPTKTVIEKTLTSFLDSTRPQDRILVFFVGHAVELGDEVYLAPIEGELDKAETLIPLKWMYEQLAKCKARQKVLVLDGNRYNQTLGQERPGGEEMGPKLDAMLQAPPAGVQVWSSCSPKQRSFASDDYPMGIFLEALQTALQHGGNGKIQKPEQALPLEHYVAMVNKLMADDLRRRKLEQVSRLTGKETEEGAAYDPKAQLAPNAALALASPPAGVEKNKMLVESVLEQIGTPPVKVTHEMALRYDALPPFPAEALKKYEGDKPNPDSPLRKAIQHARAALWAIYPGQEPKELRGEVSVLRQQIGAQLNVLKEGYRAPAGGNAEKGFKNGVENDERKVARLLRGIEDALSELRDPKVVEARGTENKRWQANYDLILARVQMEYAYLFEYQSMLGSMRKEFPARDPQLHGGWKLAAHPNLQGDSTGKKSAKDAQKLLDKIIKSNAGSPWEVLAKREKLTNLGLEWQPAK